MFGILFSKKDGSKVFAKNKRDAFDAHLNLAWKIKELYKKRDVDPQALQAAINLCWQQIEMAEDAKAAWIKENDELEIRDGPMPTHQGYQQLCVIFEKQKWYDETIRLAKEAKARGWNGDWDRRIERCERKLSNNKNT